MTLLIKDVFIVQDDSSLLLTDIFISEGKIADISSRPGSHKQDANEVINGEGLIAVPGMIDCHVHFREPGFTHKEDFFTGSCAAAAGGVTTVFDMPNTEPKTITVDALEEKRKIAKKSVVNFGFHFGTDTNNIDEIKKAKNIASVKVFFDSTTGDMKVDDIKKIEKVFAANRRIMTHSEGENAKLAMELIKKTKNNLHIAHVAIAEEIEFIREAKNKQITVEVTPHHLFLTENDRNVLKDTGKEGFFDVKPSLKTRQDQEALWNAVRDGTIDTIGTDHAPHTKSEKKKDPAPYGLPGVETALPLMLNAVNEKKLTLKRLIELTSINPAKIFRIKNKGKIQKGYDADITLIDMSIEKVVKNDKLYTKCKWSPFEGRKLKGWPVYTIVNGNIVFDKGKIYDVIKGREVEFDG